MKQYFNHECRVFRQGFQTRKFVFEYLETPVKHEARVFEMASQSATNYKQRILSRGMPLGQTVSKIGLGIFFSSPW